MRGRTFDWGAGTAGVGGALGWMAYILGRRGYWNIECKDILESSILSLHISIHMLSVVAAWSTTRYIVVVTLGSIPVYVNICE